MPALVQTVTADQILLNGLYFKNSSKKSDIGSIFIHGFTGDFYSHRFYRHIVHATSKANVQLILGQHRGTGIETEFITTEGKGVYLGSYFEKLEDAHLDISAWIKFFQTQGINKLVLIGHSLGTIKSIRYLLEGEYAHLVCGLILLAPFDKNAYVERKTNGKWHEHVKIARKKIISGHELERIPDTFDDYPMSYQTYYSWYRTSELSSVWDFYDKNYDFPILNQIQVPTSVIFGENDDVLYMPEFNNDALEIKNIISNNLKPSKVHIIKDCNHTFNGHEKKVEELIRDYLNELKT